MTNATNMFLNAKVEPLGYAYRFEEMSYAPVGDDYESRMDVHLRKYEILKFTPKGFCISNWSKSGKRFILNTSRKKYAHITIEDAKTSFIARKNRQYNILSNKIQNVMKALKVFQEKFK
jgi:hypothetical protein